MIAALIVAIFLWVVVVPVALALIARFMVARTARARRRATRVSMWLLPLYVASVAAMVVLAVMDDVIGGARTADTFFCFALVLAGVSPLVGMAVLYATEFAQLEKSPEVCDSCGYLRQGAAGVRCPECGVPWGS